MPIFAGCTRGFLKQPLVAQLSTIKSLLIELIKALALEDDNFLILGIEQSPALIVFPIVVCLVVDLTLSPDFQSSLIPHENCHP